MARFLIYNSRGEHTDTVSAEVIDDIEDLVADENYVFEEGLEAVDESGIRWSLSRDGFVRTTPTPEESMIKSMVEDGDPEWRCTRPGYYQADCPGRTNPRSRQGHYIRAPNEEVARLIMNRDYPGEEIDVERWKN